MLSERRYPCALRLGFCLMFSLMLLWSGAAWAQQPALKLFVSECGHNQVADQSVLSPGINKGVGRSMPIRCYLIQHPKGMLLWGTGLNDGLIDKPEGILVANGNFRLTVRKTMRSQLEEIGVAPEDITYVAMSHMHPDQSGNGSLFSASTLIMQEEEYAAAFGDNPGQYSFNPRNYGKLADSQAIKLKGDHDVFGDGSVVIKRSIGHTPGHQSLFVDLPQTGPVFLTGDLWPSEENRRHRRVPVSTFDKAALLRSMTRMEAFIAEKKAKVWIQHGSDLSKRMRYAPKFYQ